MGRIEWMDAPDAGGLDAVSVPLLLAQAWRDRRSGRLQLTQGQREQCCVVRDGAPVSLEAAPEDDAFATFLADAGRISAPDRAKVEKLARERACPHASAVLALRLLDAKALYTELRRETRIRIATTFEWTNGTYRWTDLAEAEADAGKARPHDLLSLLQEELPRRWGTDRLFAAILQLESVTGDVSPLHRKILDKLAQAGPPAAQALGLVDGTRPLGRILGECAGDPLAAATLWTLAHTGILRRDHVAVSTESAEYEFEVEIAETADPTAGATPLRDATDKAANASADPKAAALRSEIEILLGQLSSLDHYAALGLDASANAALIKKAYFKAAKKYHPDALARLGLDDLKEPAAAVFARIAEAFETLSDDDKKRAYDAGGSDEPEIDTARLAQAETSFRKGEILAKMGNFEGALEYFEPAVELWPEEPAYQAGLGWALYKSSRRDVERAAFHLDLALAQAPEDAVIHFRLGLVLRAAGDEARATEFIDRARSLDANVEDSANA